MDDRDGTPSHVLKISQTETVRETIVAETGLLAFLGRPAAERPGKTTASTAPSPQPLPARDGDLVVTTTDDDGETCHARLVTWLDGRPAAHAIWSPELYTEIGRQLARLDRRLATYEGPMPAGHPTWDLDRGTLIVREGVEAMGDPRDRTFVDDVVARIDDHLATLGTLPRQLIHGDANDHNLLVGCGAARRADRVGRFEPDRVTGILDFGDALVSSRVNDLAIALAYALSASRRHAPRDPVAAVLPMVAAYHAESPLQEVELAALFPKALLRLAVSVVRSAIARAAEPGNDYLAVSESGAWTMLRRFADAAPEPPLPGREPRLWRQIEWRLRAACGLDPCPHADAFPDALRALPVRPVMGDEASAFRLVDLSFESGSLVGDDPSDQASLTRTISQHLGVDCDASLPDDGPNRSPIGWGRYIEPRALYVGPQYGTADQDEGAPEPRTVHLGVDLFAPPNSPVFAPLDGTVHSFADNALDNDYGPTILLEHQVEVEGEAQRFLTLYGHLSRASLEGLQLGQTIRAGAEIARLGTADVNGGWTPHLHFQIVLDPAGAQGTFPGVGEASQRDIWSRVCPDPNLLLRWKSVDAAPVQARRSDLARRRGVVLAPSLSLSYDRPLHITRGRAQFLYEATGHRFLDLVNNVCHVGHCHPKVTDALCRQARALNTNSRYLHRNVVDYAERLLGTLPKPENGEPLEVCFFVNSGSEANDLALRIARAATGRRDAVCMEGAYHGHVASTIEVSPYKHDGPGGAGTPGHVHKVAMPDAFRGRHRAEDHDDLGAAYASEVEAIVREHSVAAFIGEPILSCGGQIELPPGYLRRVYRAIRNQGGVCIADEVQVGFGRVGSHFWAFETQGVVPDIVTIGKPIGNGHPLAAVVTTRRRAEAFANGMEYFNTYGGNPVSCAVGLAVLDVIDDEELQSRAARLGTLFRSGLEQLAARYAAIGDVRGLGLFLGFELIEESDPAAKRPDPDLAWYLAQWMRERGVLLSTDGPDINVIKIKPPLVVEAGDIDRTLELLQGFFQTIGRTE